ncbi:DUF4297 domain-containing protein [Marivirga sp. S37H4]|uniref:DUF4297 domain-containing protein n=1 Tax=Marivirga aurantiaca TaxID=2802615 RepID=A0A934X0F4_9BACT|nr:DUF4297 domain-containing protein [Marivirga aurantiaca]MBK6266145.1 DUF4297 domain-containing protein [Marivirga aurantiaca]
MNELKQNIISTRPRENSGSSSSNRFDYQKDWAICKLLELHTNPEDYLLTLEHHDDVIIFDSSSDPTKISFYQVKTNKKNHWTLNELIKQKKGKTSLLNSPLGKLFDHLVKFGNKVESLNFITNNKVKGVLADKSKCEDTSGFCLSELKSTELDKIIVALKNEHSLNDLKDFQNITFFKLGELDIDKHSDLAKARIVDFLDKNFSDLSYKIAPLYKSIFDEIKMKTDYEKSVTNFEELKSKKSISRNDFDRYIKELESSNTIPKTTLSIENRLNAENASFQTVQSFKAQSRIYELKKMSYNDKAFRRIESEIRKTKSELTFDEKSSLLSCQKQIINELNTKNLANNSVSEALIEAMVLYIIYE